MPSGRGGNSTLGPARSQPFVRWPRTFRRVAPSRLRAVRDPAPLAIRAVGDAATLGTSRGLALRAFWDLALFRNSASFGLRRLWDCRAFGKNTCYTSNVMPNDELAWIEAALGAAAKMTPAENADLEDARCPKCNAADFVKISDLYTEAQIRLEVNPEDADLKREDRALGPPDRREVPLPAAHLRPRRLGHHRRDPRGHRVRRLSALGQIPGELVGAGGVIVLAVVTLTSLRRFSDQHYHRRRQWNRMYKCRVRPVDRVLITRVVRSTPGTLRPAAARDAPPTQRAAY